MAAYMPLILYSSSGSLNILRFLRGTCLNQTHYTLLQRSAVNPDGRLFWVGIWMNLSKLQLKPCISVWVQEGNIWLRQKLGKNLQGYMRPMHKVTSPGYPSEGVKVPTPPMTQHSSSGCCALPGKLTHKRRTSSLRFFMFLVGRYGIDISESFLSHLVQLNQPAKLAEDVIRPAAWRWPPLWVCRYIS